MTRLPLYAALALAALSAAAGPTTRPVDLIRQGADLAERDAAVLTTERDVARARADEMLALAATRAGELAVALAERDRLRPRLSVGLNVDENTDYSTDACFANLFLRMAAWGKPDKPWEPNPGLTLNPDGYPLADAGTFTYASGYPSGDYSFRMEGSGVPAFSSKGRFTSPVLRAGDVVTGTVRIDANAGGLLQFRVTGIDPANPPRNFRLILPGLAVDTPRVANPAFADAVAPFPGPLRYSVGGLRINTDEAGTVADFAARVRPAEFPQTSRRGVALEHLIDLANECGKDVWLAVPDRASDTYLAELAAFVAARLDRRAAVWVEYSNEVTFNSRFPQWGRVRADSSANGELTATDANERHWQQVAWQTRRVALIMRPKLGRRLRVVLGVQAAWPEQAEVCLSFLKAKYGPPADYLYALSVSCYRNSAPAVTSVDDVFASFAADLASPAKRAKDAKSRAAASAYGLRLVAYESSRTTPGKGGNPDPRDAAQLDPRMGKDVADLLAYAEGAGFETVCYFTGLAKLMGQTEGRYALAESLLKLTDSPKWVAAVTFAARAGGN